jgi:hypothetical protein
MFTFKSDLEHLMAAHKAEMLTIKSDSEHLMAAHKTELITSELRLLCSRASAFMSDVVVL